MAVISTSKKVRRLLPILEKCFGRREKYGTHPPVEQALVTLLLKDGKENPAQRAINRLKQVFVDWNEVRVCEPEFFGEILGRSYPPSIGYLIHDTLTAIFNYSQAMHLDDVMEMDPEHAETRLTKLNGMPSRVIGELLLAKLAYTKVPAAAGLLRVAKRTKIVAQHTPDLQTETLRRLVPAAIVPRAFHAFEMLAERICTADGFDCRKCPINQHCPTGSEQLEQMRVQEEKEDKARKTEKESRKLKPDPKHKAKAKAHKKVAAARLKKTIQVRSKKLKILAHKVSKPHPKSHVPATRMVQASSADVKPRRGKRKRRTSKVKRPVRPHR